MHAFVHLHAQSHLHSLARRTQAQTRMAYIRSYWRKRTSCRQQWMPRKLHASSRPKNSWHAAKRPFAFATPSPAFSPAFPLFLPPSPSPASSLLPAPFVRLFSQSDSVCVSFNSSVHTHTHGACVQTGAVSGTQTDTHSHITKTTGEGRSGVGRMGGCATVLGSHQQARIRRPVPAAAKRDPAGSCRHLRPRLGESASDLTVCPVWPLRCLAFKSCPYCSAACA